MMLVRTKIGPSEISGIGLFSNQFIKKGTPVWKFQSGFDLEIKKENLSLLSDAAKEQFLNYSYLDKETGAYILCFDDARFFNHSEKPNCIEIESPDRLDWIYVADKDISEGEELTCDYQEFDMDFKNKIKDSLNK